MSLDKRVAALEQKAGTDTADGLTVWVVKFVSPGRIDDEPTAYRSTDGQRWDRQEGESLETLKERATREVVRNERSMAVLIEDCSADA